MFKGGADGGAEMAKRQLHKLSAREAETIGEPGRHGDGGGLYLVIEAGAHSRRQWIFLYRVHGTSKRKELGLGPAKGKGKDGLSLADARLRAADARKKLTEGKDPAAERRAAKMAGITFGEFADALLQSIKSGFKGKKTYADWKRDLEVRCQPIRSKQLQEIKTTDILAILSPMWLAINRTARETRSRIERVFMAARAKGLRSGENPAIWRGNLKELLPKAKRSKRHHQAAPYKDVPRIVRALQEKHKSADSNVNLAAEFIILTAVRTGEARFMRARGGLCREALDRSARAHEDGRWSGRPMFRSAALRPRCFDPEGRDPEGRFPRCICFCGPVVEKWGETAGHECRAPRSQGGLPSDDDARVPL